MPGEGGKTSLLPKERVRENYREVSDYLEI